MIKSKAVFVGDSGVGKTSIFQRFETDEFHDEHVFTVGGAYAKVSVVTKAHTTVDIGLWDTAGQERFRNIIPMYFQKADFVIVVYDISNRESFDHVIDWVSMAREKAPESAKILIVGNKYDLTEQRAINTNECSDLAQQINACFNVEVSAKSAQGIDILLQELGELTERFSNELCENVISISVETHDSDIGISQIGNQRRKKKDNCC